MPKGPHTPYTETYVPITVNELIMAEVRFQKEVVEVASATLRNETARLDALITKLQGPLDVAS